jgi:glycosyltransferase involved in cell wall biosynthesis
MAPAFPVEPFTVENVVKEPLVSVIIPTHNRARLVSRAIRSVLTQTYAHLECVVVDDASDDDTGKVVQDIQDGRIVYLRHETNLHASAARNTGIAQAGGNLLAFLDDDDEWLPRKLEKQVGRFLKVPEKVGMIYCWMDYFDQMGNLIKEHHPELRGYVFPEVLDAQRLGGCPTLLLRKEVVEKVGGFDESLPRGNDGDFIRRVCYEYEVDCVPEVLVKVHVGHGLERISSNDAVGVRHAIMGNLAKLSKFGDEVEKYPGRFAHIYSTIAFHYIQAGEVKKGIRFFVKALKTDPFSWKIYVDCKKSAKQIVSARKNDRSDR